MASDDPRRPEEEQDPRRRPQDRNTEPIPRPESAGDYDEDTDTPEVLPPEIQEEELRGLRAGSGLPVGRRSGLPLGEEASSLVSRYPLPTEKLPGAWRKHWVHRF